MNRLPAALALLLLSVVASAQAELKEFLAARDKNGIQAALTKAAYNDFTGSGVFEVRCRVTGCISSHGDTLMVETPDGLKLNIRTENKPEFLHTGTLARLIVKLTRATVNSETEVELLLSTLEATVADHDAAQAEVKARKDRSLSSRSGTRMARPMASPTSTPSLQGQIGQGAGSMVDVAPSPAVQPTGDMAVVVDAYGAYIQGVNPRLDRATANAWADYIIQYCTEVDLDPRLMIALIVAESDFKPETTSNKGAMGLCQLMSDEVRRWGLSNAYDPRQNIWASTRLLREGIDKYKKLGYDDWKSTVLALAGYNAGHGAVKKYGYSIPPYRETQGYVAKISSLYKKFVGSE